MKVKLICGGQYAYACIQWEKGVMDVRLEPGRSAGASMRETAAEMRAKAEKLKRDADLIDAASMFL